ncbi:tyrosyl-trna synthetase [Ophiostoma piceae UAMH 11346]|uniref:Tyrosine--tRNA ligase n=1 Tax=Ophiostoma piceae (strain UAMH 11346) TaxID=1262450 RepID=S3C377_OPHP1|nr:tyrosyl-trna synthetase [Ophiostoma piceae UAMH 11346]
MALSTVARRLPPQGVQICRRCALQLFPLQQRQQPRQQSKYAQTQTTTSSPFQVQRRHMSGHSFGKYGPKYTAKIDAADKEWKEKGVRIKEGLEPNLWDTFEQRGYVKDVAGNPDDIRKLFIEKRTGAYVGIDPTAHSLHLGHLLPLMPLFWMYMNGFRAVTLIGGATARIGDPTGRLVSRDKMKSADVAMNMVKIHYQLKKLWVNADIQARRYGYKKTWAWRRGILQNGHWWNKLPLLDVLQRLGAGMRIGPMLSRDSVKRKMTEGDGVSFAEFTYPLLQAWDWWHMYFTQGIQVQIGGSDQYGNIVTGADSFKIIRGTEPDPAKKLPQRGYIDDPVGFTVPLLTDSAGNKFGKSAGNAIWMDKFDTPVFECYGYFMRRSDDDVDSLLKLFTFIPAETIGKIMERHREDPAMRLAQHVLAFEVSTLVHGMADADMARRQHWAMYRKNAPTGEEILNELEAPKNIPRATTPDDIEAAYKSFDEASEGPEGGDYTTAKTYRPDEADDYALPKAKTPVTPNNAPRVDMQLPQSLIDEGKIARILYAAGLASSVSDGNRIAVQKGAYVGAAPGQKAHENKGMNLINVDYTPVHLWFPKDTKNFIIDDKYLVLRKGKHNIRIIEIVSDEQWKASGRTYRGEPFTGKIRQMRSELKELKTLQLTRDELIAEMKKSGEEVPRAKHTKTGSSRIVFPSPKNSKLTKLQTEIDQAKDTMRSAGLPESALKDVSKTLADLPEDAELGGNK